MLVGMCGSWASTVDENENVFLKKINHKITMGSSNCTLWYLSQVNGDLYSPKNLRKYL
jgi:hypothetical protein